MAQEAAPKAQTKQEEAKSSDAEPQAMAKLIFEKIGANDLHISRVGGWLESRFHFRFANWRPQDPKRRSFGKLHVLNDDIVEPKNGFGFHPHQNQEIFSYILRGHLTHEDSEGNKETLTRGHVQYMSAGAGVWHSELNNNHKEQCRFLQTWIKPNKVNLAVQYGSYSPKYEDRHNQLFTMISGQYADGKANSDDDKVPIRLHQDVNVYVSEMDHGKSVRYQLGEDRQAYLVCPEGSVQVNGQVELETRAAVRLFGPVDLHIVAKGTEKDEPGAHIMMIEMKKAVKP